MSSIKLSSRFVMSHFISILIAPYFHCRGLGLEARLADQGGGLTRGLRLRSCKERKRSLDFGQAPTSGLCRRKVHAKAEALRGVQGDIGLGLGQLGGPYCAIIQTDHKVALWDFGTPTCK